MIKKMNKNIYLNIKNNSLKYIFNNIKNNI